VDRLGVADLTWHEVAEAVWLAAAIRPTVEPDPPAVTRTPPNEVSRVPNKESDGQSEDTSKGEVDSRPQAADSPTQPAPTPARPATESARPHRDVPLRLLSGDLIGAAPATGWSLPDRLDIVRALRPLKRDVRSRRVGDVVIDEVATAERAVQDELWWPVTKQRRERWLDFTVALDCSPSMTLWHAKVNAFVELLEQLGAFRTVRVRRLDTNRSSAGVALSPVLRGGPGNTVPCDPAEVIDPSGRRVVLVITDGLGDAWRCDLVGPILARWGRTLPVSVIHLLPQWMWGRAGPALHRARLSASNDLRPNHAWHVDLPDAWAEPEPDRALPHGAVPIPVLELGPRWLRWWTDLVTGTHQTRVDATVMLVGDKPHPRVSTFHGPDERSPRQRLAEFRSVASPEAQRLAQLLAALPVDMTVAKLIKELFVPGSGPDVIVELITAGLLRFASRTTSAVSTVDIRIFDIVESDREILLEGARRTDTARVVRTAAQHLGDQNIALALLRDAIVDPQNTSVPTAAEDLALQRVVLRALSGPYLTRADRIDDQLSAEISFDSSPSETTSNSSDPIPPASRSPLSPVSSPVGMSPLEGSTMSNAAEHADLQTERPAVSSQPEINISSAPEPVTTPLTPTIFGTGSGKREPGDAPPIWGNVPPRNLNFTGCDDLNDQLRAQLTAGGATAVLPATLHGMGGIGKTQTAAEYIYCRLDDCDLVWRIPEAQPTQIRSGLTRLTHQLHLSGEVDVVRTLLTAREGAQTVRIAETNMTTVSARHVMDQPMPNMVDGGLKLADWFKRRLDDTVMSLKTITVRLRHLGELATELLSKPGAQPLNSAPFVTQYRMVFAVDIVGYSKLTGWQQQKHHNRLQGVISEILQDLMVTVPGNDRRDTGDGWIVFLPVGLDPAWALPTLIRSARSRISANNGIEDPSLRLRMAIGMGLVIPGRNTFSGAAVIEVVRLLDSDVIRSQIADHPAVDLAVIVSNRLYSDVVGIGNVGIPADQFHEVQAIAKDFDEIAWLWRAAM
jgi:hypothetical protein